MKKETAFFGTVVVAVGAPSALARRNGDINSLGRLEVHEKFKSHLNLQPSR